MNIHDDVCKSVNDYLNKRYIGYKLYVPNVFPKLFFNPFENTILTPLNDVYILTNNISFADLNEELDFDDLDISKHTKYVSSQFAFKLIIIGSVYNVTTKYISEKLSQMEKIQMYLSLACDDNNPNFTSKYKNMVNFFNFDMYESKPMIFIGGAKWNEDALEMMQDLINEHDNIAMVELQSNKYVVKYHKETKSPIQKLNKFVSKCFQGINK